MELDEDKLKRFAESLIRKSSSDRLYYILDADHLSNLEMAKVLLLELNSCDHISLYRVNVLPLLNEYFAAFGQYVEELGEDEPAEAHESRKRVLAVGPEEWLTIYRGASSNEWYADGDIRILAIKERKKARLPKLTPEELRKLKRLGISWTLNRQIAVNFTTQFSRHRAKEPMLFTTRIQKRDAIAFIFSRNEEEVFVDSARFREDVSWHFLKT
jgi:hypothetical protein